MKEITFISGVLGDATKPVTTYGNRIIAHICNNRGAWGRGFVLALSARFPEPEQAYRSLPIPMPLGRIQLVPIHSDPRLFVCNMIAQVLGDPTGVNLRYDALKDCLHVLAEAAIDQNATVHMPRIGCGLAGGKWELVEPIIEQKLCTRDIPVYVYTP